MPPTDEFDSLARRLVALLLDDARLRTLAQAVAGLMLDDPRFRQIVKEVSLRTVLEIEQQKASGPVREFLRACDARRVEVGIDWRTGVLVVSPLERLGSDLETVLAARRAEITAHLKGRQ